MQPPAEGPPEFYGEGPEERFRTQHHFKGTPPEQVEEMLKTSHRHLSEMQFGQLPMFMSASEIQQQYQPLPEDASYMGISPDDHERLWATKLREAKGSGHYAEVQDRGVRTPVHLGELEELGTVSRQAQRHVRTVLGGHHRIAIMSDLDPDMPIPVRHYESFWDLDEDYD